MITRKQISILLCGLILFAVIAVSCSEDSTSMNYETHPTGWMNPSSEEFHGTASIPTGAESCGGCHALATALPDSQVTNTVGMGSCFDCHDYYPHLWESRSEHKAAIHEADWDLAGCASCHGADFAGGNTGASCNDCHGSGTTPALTSCNLCHMNPPANDEGLPAGFVSGAYGAHAIHAIDKKYPCSECHKEDYGIDHVNALPADVSFEDADIATEDSYEPLYLHSGDPGSGNGSCGTVYCHGNSTVSWLGGPVSCESCHPVLPPPVNQFHEAGGECHTCHELIDPASDYSTPEGILFRPEFDSLHVNGRADYIIN